MYQLQCSIPIWGKTSAHRVWGCVHRRAKVQMPRLCQLR